MPIVTSEQHIDAHTQTDGSRYSTQIVTENTGRMHQRVVRLAAGNDGVSMLAQYVVEVNASLKDGEARSNLDAGKYVLVHCTETEILERIRDLYQQSMGYETCRIARWIIDRLNAAAFTVAAIRAVWGMSPPQWNSFNGILDVNAASYTSVETANGMITS